MVSQLPPDAMNYNATHQRDVWHCWVPVDTRSEDVTKSAFWVHVMPRLKPGALIDLVTRDGLLDMTVRIISVNNGIVQVNVLRKFENEKARKPILDAVDKSRKAVASGVTGAQLQEEIRGRVPPGYKVGYHPTKQNWYVQLTTGNTSKKLIEDVVTRELALEWCINHAKAAGVEIPDQQAA